MGSSATKTEPASAPAADPAPAPRGFNGPSHDDIRMAVNEQLQWNMKREALNAQIGTFRKELKLRGFTLGVLDDKVRQLEWTPEEVKAHHAEQDHYAEAMRFPIGTQLEFYGTEKTPDAVREQLRWRNMGFTDGVAGKGWSDEPPDGCPPECRQSYGEGHEEGAATVRRAFVARAQKVGPVTAGVGESEEDDGDLDDGADLVDSEGDDLVVTAAAEDDADEEPSTTAAALDALGAEGEAELVAAE